MTTAKTDRSSPQDRGRLVDRFRPGQVEQVTTGDGGGQPLLGGVVHRIMRIRHGTKIMNRHFAIS